MVFNILIATHGKMSNGLKDAAETITGMEVQIDTINLISGKVIEEIGQEVTQVINNDNSKEGLLILTDIVSASPYNQSVLAVGNSEEGLQNNIYIIGGVNLPMLLEAINHQLLNNNIQDAVEDIILQGKNGINQWHISQLEDESEDDDF
ncbi:PTS sugar transporter subunit IIA [Eremococcus coleocola]|uniref:PTS sugar transporter subunit IIA n=1 Tax=Eremococcus coleocola TaxID=88132 RepID=UPI00048045D9|nr:PTS sugar transporter subunit IIA [Eremococcus coleocola]